VSTTTSPGAAAGGTVSHPTTQTSPTKLAASDTAAHGQGGDSALPIIIVALVVLALGGAAWFRWRRRPAEE
jgi:hypothetical protein